MATETATAEHKEAAAGAIILLFELENVALAGRKRLYDLVKKQAAAVGVQITPGLFGRHGLKPTAEQNAVSVAEGAGASKAQAEKIGHDVQEAYTADLAGKIEVNAPIVKLLQSALKKGFQLGAISALTEEQAAAALQRLDLGSSVRLLAQKPVDAIFPRAENWVKLVKLVSRSVQPAVAVVSSQSACKSALAAGLRCVVIPDEFTSHQDFGGADLIVDNAAEFTPADVLGVLANK